MLKTEINLLEVTISTERLLLVPTSLEYKEDVFKEFDDEVTLYMFPAPAKNISETEEFINSSRKKMSEKKELV